MKINLSAVEQDMLRRMSIKQLQFMIKIAHDPDFGTLEKAGDLLADYEKDVIFRFPETNPQALAIEKAHARGRASGYKQMGRLILSASAEIERREEEIEKRKEAKNNA